MAKMSRHNSSYQNIWRTRHKT